jgi:hypothetical protein
LCFVVAAVAAAVAMHAVDVAKAAVRIRSIKETILFPFDGFELK